MGHTFSSIPFLVHPDLLYGRDVAAVARINKHFRQQVSKRISREFGSTTTIQAYLVARILIPKPFPVPQALFLVWEYTEQTQYHAIHHLRDDWRPVLDVLRSTSYRSFLFSWRRMPQKALYDIPDTLDEFRSITDNSWVSFIRQWFNCDPMFWGSFNERTLVSDCFQHCLHSSVGPTVRNMLKFDIRENRSSNRLPSDTWYSNVIRTILYHYLHIESIPNIPKSSMTVVDLEVYAKHLLFFYNGIQSKFALRAENCIVETSNITIRPKQAYFQDETPIPTDWLVYYASKFPFPQRWQWDWQAELERTRYFHHIHLEQKLDSDERVGWKLFLDMVVTGISSQQLAHVAYSGLDS